MALCTLPGWRDEMEGGEGQVEDEFACPGLLTGPLQTIKPTVERVFEVNLRIGGDENFYTPQDEQVWLQLRGSKRQVEAAKLFIKGIVNQEAQKEVQYPDVLHCVFCGARGLFMDCLVRNTSAHIVVGSLGCLLISGLDEPVVRAYSLIMDLVDRYKCSQERPTAPAESLNSRLAFKSLVQRLEDHHTLELLVLPVLVKEVLLDLFEQSGLDPSNVSGEAGSAEVATPELSDSRIPDVLDRPPVPNGASYTNPPSSPLRHFFPESHNHGIKVHGTSEQVGLEPGEDACNPSHFFRGVITEGNKDENGRDKWAGVVSLDTEDEQRESQQQDENLLSAGSKQEYEHLLKFFTAMGYNEEVVCRVLTRTGPREASQVLDLIQQEQEKSMIEEGSGKSSAAASDREVMHGPEKITENETVNGALGGNAEDFVLGVMKQAAASCGYTEEKVAEVYSSLPALKPHQLILELQKESTKADEPREDIEGMRTEKPEDQPRKATTPQKAKKKDLKEQKRNEKTDGKSAATNMEKTNKETVGSLKEKPKKKEVKTAQRGGRAGPEPIIPGHFSVPGATDWQSGKPEILLSPPNQPTFQTIPSNVRGPPQPIYPSLNQPKFLGQHITTTESLATKPKHKMGHSMVRAGAVVTGEQRYLEGIATPFTLQLKDDPGDPGLRQIIIDGSNVAMSHGLGIFFSCRGIALAVQYFWSRGHRKITVFVPQWRQKRDPRIKEQQFMSQLQDLGLLSFTPSREVMGKRINSYDDRFMLQLAQQTDGVIVTNDNLRDLVEESAKWREIVKNRLLQYVFAGDLFMVPDDPLGRGGPHIDHFLRKQNSQPVPRSHSFAGVPSSFPPPSSHPRAQTEVLQYRDLTTGGRDRALGRIPAQTNKNVTRTVDETMKLKQELVQIFPGQESMITMALQCNPNVKDINDLSHFILEQQQEEIEEL